MNVSMVFGRWLMAVHVRPILYALPGTASPVIAATREGVARPADVMPMGQMSRVMCALTVSGRWLKAVHVRPIRSALPGIATTVIVVMVGNAARPAGAILQGPKS